MQTASTRLVHTSCRPSSLVQGPSSSTRTVSKRLRCMNQQVGGFSSENIWLNGDAVKKSVVVAKASALGSAIKTDQGVNLAIIKAHVLYMLKTAMRPRPWTSITQSFIEKVIIDCRFFTMFAVAGTLLGSVLCFIEGSFLVMESYLQYFHALSHHSDHGLIIHLLIEALDMFLVGTAMLTFGMGLQVMFVGYSRGSKGDASGLPSSNFFGLFHLTELPSWVEMKSMGHAKSKIGHSLMLLLQVGVIEKFKSIPLVTSADLACFAGALLVLSTGIFILSRLSFGSNTDN